MMWWRAVPRDARPQDHPPTPPILGIQAPEAWRLCPARGFHVCDEHRPESPAPALPADTPKGLFDEDPPHIRRAPRPCSPLIFDLGGEE